MNSFLSRILVALIGLPVVLVALWGGGWWLFAVLATAAFVALHEFFLLTRPLRPVSLAGYTGLAGVLLALEVSDFGWAVGALLATLALAFLLKGLGATQGSSTVAVAVTVLGTAWIGFGLGCTLQLRAVPDHGFVASLAVLLAIWADDTAAYFGGRTFGRHKLAPAISPGKTWEGFVCGTIVAIFVVFVTLYKDRDEFLSIGQSLVLGLVVALAAPLGDLFESMLKRDMGVKDSGRLLGGHGGMLDRIDAILFAFPAAYFTVLAFLT
jgi:phosphatidate cytidylyltransferase